MAIFREWSDSGQDRAAEDRRRHRELVEDSIKKNIGSIISEESIIGQSRDKKIKIPIKSIKEYQFIYGKNNPGVGSGDGTEKKGDKVGSDKDSKASGDGKAGNSEGEDIYETEITIEELINYLFEDIDLPDIDRRKIADLEQISMGRKLGYQKKGIPPRLAKRRSTVEKIKRKQATKRALAEEGIAEAEEGEAENELNLVDGEEKIKGRFPFIEDDLRYHRIREEKKKDFNAVVICIMDISGSMDQSKKYMARSFYFMLYQFLRLKYESVEVVFVAHTTVAKEVNENEFFHKGESGGTYISSGYEKALEIIELRYNPANWNIYAFHCTDGDNWSEDNNRAVEYANKLCRVANLFGYGEIVPGFYSSNSTIKSQFLKGIDSKNFVAVTMSKKEDILPALKKFMDKESE